MNYLVVFAHPNPESFGKGIVETIRETIEAKEENIQIRDLYSLEFDSILKPSDFEALKNGNIPDDIKAEQERIKWADIIIFVYPVWWAGLPAILKGYVDRVLSYGFGYEYVDGEPRGLLKGKRGLFICTTGTPREIYEQSGMHNSMKQTSDEGIFSFCGIEVIKHLFFGAVPYVSEETRKDYLKDVENLIKSL